MKIIDTDNFGGDYPNEKVIAEGIKREDHAKIMCEALNRQSGKDSARYYMVVADNYALRPGFEP